MQSVINLFGTNGFIPHGCCLSWSLSLLWLHVLSDTLIVLAYYSIPLTLAYFVRKRKDLPYRWLFRMFELFIVACGTTHLLSVVTIWIPLYWLDGIVKAVTAVISVAAALMMFWIVPRALLLRSPAQLEVEVQERRRAEAALHQSQEELHKAQRIAHMGSWHMDVATNHVVWTEELYRIFGLDPELPPPDYPEHQKLFTPESGERLSAAVLRARETGVPYELELEMVRANGNRWVLVRGEALRDATGAIVTLQGVAIDITERKRADATLKLHKAIIDTASDGFWMCDTSGYLLEVNQAYADTMGYTREELVGMHISQLSAQSTTPELVRARIDKIIEKKIYPHLETRHRHKDGHIIYFETSNTYLAESNTICCFLRDITERKRTEQVLRASENRYRTLVENSPMCIHEIAMDGRLTSMNRAGLLVMGVKDESEVRGLSYLDSVSAADRERIGELLTRAYAGETSHFEFKPAGRRKRIFKSCFVPVMNSEGSVERLMGITEDITKRKAAEEQIRSMAFYDTLTHLPNRRLLNDRLEQIMVASKRSGHYAALMFMDLDNFKPLNDRHGHDVGDLLLVEAARRISSCVREMDTVVRFGGDEFVVMLSELDADKAKSTSQAEIVAEKIRTVLSEPYLLTIKLEGKTDATIEHHCTVSIGVNLFINREISHDDILKRADMAMYQAKEDGRNLVRFYDSKV